MQLRVAFVFVGMPVGGAEDLMVAVAPHLAKQGIEPRFVCLRERGVLGDLVQKQGHPVALVPAARSKRWSPLGTWRFARWLKENRINIVHSHTYHAHVYSVLAAALAGACSVLHQHKTIEKPKPHRWVTTWMLVRAASGLVALSEKIREDLALSYGITPDRITVVPNAVDRTEFTPPVSKTAVRQQLGLPTGVFLLGSVASLQKVKNHNATIGVVSRLTSTHPDLRVVFIGEGPERLTLEQRVRNLGLESKIRFVGNQRPVSPWIQALDLFVLASHWEGQSLAVLQAIACDVPVLASRIEGNTQTLGEDHPGLFDQTNLQEYVALVRRAMQDTGFRQELIISQARHRVPDTSEAAAKFGDLYRDLAAQTALARG